MEENKSLNVEEQTTHSNGKKPPQQKEMEMKESHEPQQQQQQEVVSSNSSSSSSSVSEAAVERQPSRKPFTALPQEDSDLALARALQDQERAYMLLRMNAESSDYETSGSGNNDNDFDGDDFVDHEDEADANIDEDDAEEDISHSLAEDIDPSQYENDEAYARALQDVEDREMTARMMTLVGIHDWEQDDEDFEANDIISQDAWQEVDPDNMVYEELLALGEVVGTQSRGLDAGVISALPSSKYKQQNPSSSNQEQCVICRIEYEEGNAMTSLPCKHHYHSECIVDWLKINKVCPICNKEVLTKQD